MTQQPILDLSSLERAVSSLEEVVQAYQKEQNNAFMRDAMIQRFEYTYELSHKMLKRYLELSEANAEEVDQMAFPTLIRTASERGLLLSDWSIWKQYREARNATSHSYHEKKAKEISLIIPSFLKDAVALHKTLSKQIKAL